MQKISQTLFKEAQEYATKFVGALNESVTQFHAVNYCKAQLKENGFQEIKEIDKWNLEGGKSYYFSRNNSTLVAFIVGEQVHNAGVSLFKIVGCHTDSPVLKLAPVSKMENRNGYQELAVQLYGGGLWHTWFDRDLTLAGKIIVKEGDKLSSRYWRAQNALMKIPNLAIHLTDRSGTFEPNKETHTRPVIATSIIDELFGGAYEALGDDKYSVEVKHFKTLINLISEDLQIDKATIVDFELQAIDHNPAQIVGLHKEFVSGARLDNLGSSLTSLDSIIETYKQGKLDHAEISMIMLFDHEEIGSQSAQGADSNMAAEITHRIFQTTFPKFEAEDYYRAIHKSFLVSADMAHAINPNYAEKHHSLHQPKIHHGIVLKTNANQRYTTDTVGASILRAVAEKAGVPIQDFIVKNDSPCGSTIGPMMAAKAGIKTVDIGAPQLAMHSIRETCGVIDLLYYRRLFLSFFSNYSSIPTDLLSE